MAQFTAERVTEERPKTNVLICILICVTHLLLPDERCGCSIRLLDG
jgi:hypothetical protein